MFKMLGSYKKVIKDNFKPILYVIIFSLLLVIIDQSSKWLAWNFLGPVKTISSEGKLDYQVGSQIVNVIPNFLSFNLLTNNGAAFGLGSGELWARIVFIIISWVVFLFVPLICIYYLKKHQNKIKTTYLIAFILIYGGNFGNLIDRTFYWSSPCGVIDFIDITDLIPNFGVFNLADSFVVIGVLFLLIVLIIEMIKGDDKSEKELEEIKKDSSDK